MKRITSKELADILELWWELPPDYREYFAGEYLSPTTRLRLLEARAEEIVN
jgi:hypothetical protein